MEMTQGMSEHGASGLIDDFLGSAHVLAAIVADAIEAESLREAGGIPVTLSQLKLLKLVSMTEAQTISDVAAVLGVSNAAASKAVDKLVRMMLLRRSEGETDRRSIHLSLTEPSRRLLAAYQAARLRKLEQVFGSFELNDLRQAAQLLDRISARIVEQGVREGQMCLQCGIYFREKCVLRELTGRQCLFQHHKERSGRRGSEPAAPADMRK